MIGLLISLLILVVVFGILWWVIDMIPLPQPFHSIARVVLVVIIVLSMADAVVSSALQSR